MTKTISEREIAFATLYEITENGVYSHVILGEVLNKYQYLEKRERAFITRVVEGTLEHQIELDYILDQFSKTKTRKMKPVIRCILRMSVYQLKYMDSVPVHAVCNEAVKLAVKKIDQACAKGILKKNTASRKVSRLSKAVSAMA